MKKGKINYSLIVLYGAIIFGLAYMTPVEIDWRPTFDLKHSQPYGLKVVDELKESLFKDIRMIVSEESIYKTVQYFDTMAPSPENYVFINSNLTTLDTFDIDALLDFTYKGNTTFISTHSLPYRILDTLKIDLEYNDWGYNPLDSFTRQTLVQNLTSDTSSFWVNELRLTASLRSDSGYLETPLQIMEGDTIMAEINFGTGRFIIHTAPYLFTNYHLLTGTESYVYAALSILNSSTIIFDQNYLPHNLSKGQSPLRVVLQQPMFKWAYWIVLLGLFVNILFRIKRRQRAIPTIAPLQNSSLSFIKTIGQLYYHERDNNSIAKKKITHLREYLKRRFYMKDVDFSNPINIETILNKTDLDLQETQRLSDIIVMVENGRSIDDHTLVALSNRLQKLYYQEN